MEHSQWRLGHRPGLDGLRGLAILLVLVAHTQVARLEAAGTVGVTVFFTLSGFLITSLLVEELADRGTIDLRAFFVRRFRRLAPALLLFLAVMSLVPLVSAGPMVPTTREVVGTLLYVGNYTGAMTGRDSVLLHTWSLAVEEQFYVVWPFVLLLLWRCGRRTLVPVLVLLIGYSVVARILVWDGGAGLLRVHFATDMRMDGLLVGCLAAIHVHRSGPHARWRTWAPTALVLGVTMGLLRGAGEHLVAASLVPWLTAVVIMAVVSGGVAWLSPRWLQLLGRRSYALYLWNYPLFDIASAVPAPWSLATWPLVLLLTGSIVHLSWHCVEAPFLRRRAGRPVDTARDEPDEFAGRLAGRRGAV